MYFPFSTVEWNLGILFHLANLLNLYACVAACKQYNSIIRFFWNYTRTTVQGRKERLFFCFCSFCSAFIKTHLRWTLDNYRMRYKIGVINHSISFDFMSRKNNFPRLDSIERADGHVNILNRILKGCYH